MKAIQYLCLVLFFSFSFFSCKEKEPTTTIQADSKTKVELITNYGTITLELSNETPLHRDNFIKLVNEKAYDSLLFHRVIEGFMIQGGDPESKKAAPDAMLGDGDLDYTIKAEFHPDLFHKKGALAAAREDNQDRASSAMQFFLVQGKVYNDSLLNKAEATINKRLARYHVINDAAYTNLWDSLQKAARAENDIAHQNYSGKIDTIAKNYTNFKKYTIPQSQRHVYKTLGGTPTLDQNYTVFGEVIKGMEVIDAIAAVKTDENDRPIKDVRIISAKVLE